MRGSRSTSALTPPPSWGLRRWRTSRRRRPRGRPPAPPPSRLRGCWTVGRLLIIFSTASSSLRRLPDRLFSVGSKLIVCCLSFIFLTADRLKRSSMRTQATQTDVKKSQTVTPSHVSTATASQQKHASSPGAKLKVFIFSFFLINQ